MLDAITDGKLTPAQAKAWLTSGVPSELDRIERQRRVSRMDPVDSPRRKTAASTGRRRVPGGKWQRQACTRTCQSGPVVRF
jgi:hypothetical protein